MAPQLLINVNGKGSAFRTAERGYLRVNVASTGTDQLRAFQDAQNAVTAVTSLFRNLATKDEDGKPHANAAVTAFSVTPLSTTSYYQRDQHHRELQNLPKQHKVSASAEAIFRDMVKLADVSNELATMPDVSISGTEWRLTDATRTEVEREARLKAIGEAVQKAQDYAGVVGRHVVPVEINDQAVGGGGYLSGQSQIHLMQQQMPSQPASGQGTASTGPALEPKTITFSAFVSAKFVSADDGSPA
ncbi:hypothetical protein VTK73DRAFT_3365 [Phialemonium thermophilum]|uniref:SIMPL domain-containing protein n=1 Tax=Phialemonium thermophilum TaxID=223376 RepID=A0ABR3WZI7_9PEZI